MPAPSPAAPGRPWLRRHGAFAAAALAVLAGLLTAYSNHFDNAFQFDDSHVIVGNLYLRSLDEVGRFFTDPRTFSSLPDNALYRPLLTLSYALDHWAGNGLVPRAFHRTQLALLVLLGALLGALYLELAHRGEARPGNRWLALFAASLFCLHTANTETVNYLSARSDLLSTLGIVAALLVWAAWPRGRRYHLYLLPMLAGGLAKPVTVMFAPILLAWVALFELGLPLDALVDPRCIGRALPAWRRAAPAFAAAVALYLFVRRMEASTLVYSTVSAGDYLLNQPRVWLHYFRLFLLPTGLTADTDWGFDARPTDPSFVAGVLFLAAVVVAACWLGRRERLRPAAFGLAFFVCGLVPSSTVFPLAEVYNEHRLFLPFVGLTFAFAWLAWLGLDGWLEGRGQAAPARAAIALGLGALLLVGHGVATHRRNPVWRSGESLWQDVASKSPRNARGLMNYGLALMGRGELEPALELFERAQVLNPRYAYLEINLGVVKTALDRRPEAERHFLRALELQPALAPANFYYAQFLVKSGRGPEALPYLDRCLEASPGHLQAHQLKLRLLAAVGDESALGRAIASTLGIAPDDPTARAYRDGGLDLAVPDPSADGLVILGRGFEGQGDQLAAASVYRYGLDRYPDSAAMWNNLGWARLQLGFPAAAIPCFARAAEIDPALEVARNNLAWARQLAAQQAAR